MKRIKQSIVLLLVLSMVFATGCSKSNDPIDENVNNSVEDEVENEEILDEPTIELTDLTSINNYKEETINGFKKLFDDNSVEYMVSPNGDIIASSKEYEILGNPYKKEAFAYSLCNYDEGFVDNVVDIEYEFHNEKGVDETDNTVKLIYDFIEYLDSEELHQQYPSYESFVEAVNNQSIAGELFVDYCCNIGVIELDESVNMLYFVYTETINHSATYEIEYKEFETYDEYSNFMSSVYNQIRNEVEDELFSVYNGGAGDAGLYSSTSFDMAYNHEVLVSAYIKRRNDEDNNFGLKVAFQVDTDNIIDDNQKAKMIQFVDAILRYVGYDCVTAEEIVEELMTASIEIADCYDSTDFECITCGVEKISMMEQLYQKRLWDEDNYDFLYAQYPYSECGGMGTISLYIPIKVEGCLNE